MNIRERTYENLTYLITYPKDYREGERYPVILFLHGAGSRGNDTATLRQNPFFTATAKHEPFPFITVAPLCTENTWFDLFETLERFAGFLARESYTDPARLYLMGTSMGGYATWQLAMSRPELFAAIVPVCGGGMYWNAARLVNVPIWAFHGGKDNVVLCAESQKMVDAVNRAGGSARLTVYPENGHNAWDDTYQNPDVFAWLLDRQNKNESALVDRYRGGEIYG